MTFVKPLMAAALVVGATSAHAATVEYSDAIAITQTNWSDSLSITQFDPALGTLNSVIVMLTGDVRGSANGESLDAAPATIGLDLAAEIVASTATLGDIVTSLPVVNSSFDASAFDGTIDFAGTSGVSFTDLAASDVKSATLTGADMAEFIGTGDITIDLVAEGESAGTGAGNLITQFATDAGATVKVTYDFDAAAPPPPPAVVPVPAGLPLMLLGVAALGLVRRKG